MTIHFTEDGVRLVNCLICLDAGWVHPRKEDGTPDYSQTVRCSCKTQKVENNQLPLGEESNGNNLSSER
jgi:hypothetical protein